MNPVRMAVLGVALLAGMACVALLAHGMASARPHVVAVAAPPPPPPSTRILVAQHDLQVGERLGEADIRWQTWPLNALNPAYITDGPAQPVASQTGLVAAAGRVATAAARSLASPAQGPGATLMGAIVREPMLSGEPILAAKVVHAGASGLLAVTLDPGMRAMALPLSAESAAGGFILPGDHVDVVLTRQVDTPALAGAVNASKSYVSNTVLDNVKVLAIDQNTGFQKSASVVGVTGTVEVTSKQAEALLLAKSEGQLTFVLRSYADAGGPARPGDQQSARVNPDAGVVHVFRNGVASAVLVTQ